MLYDYLYEFTVVARERSFSKAAEKLGISQPALGRHLQALETHLGTRLATRGPRGITLTPDGRQVLNRALDICSIGEAIESAFRGGGNRLATRQVLAAGFTNSITAQERLAAAVPVVGAALGPVELRYEMDYSFLSIAEALEAPAVDLVITMSSGLDGSYFDKDRFHIVRLFQSGGSAILEPSSPLAKQALARGSLAIADLAGIPVGRMEGHQGNSDLQWRELVTCCSAHGFIPTSWTVGFDYVPGWGDWYLPNCAVVFCDDTHSFERLDSLGKIVVPVEGLTYEFYGVARAGDPQSCMLLDCAADPQATSPRMANASD